MVDRGSPEILCCLLSLHEHHYIPPDPVCASLAYPPLAISGARLRALPQPACHFQSLRITWDSPNLSQKGDSVWKERFSPSQTERC